MNTERMALVDNQGKELAERGIALAREARIKQDDPGEVADVVWHYQRGRVNRGLEPLPCGSAVAIAIKRVHRMDTSRQCDTAGMSFDWSALAYRADQSRADDLDEARSMLGDKLFDLLAAGYSQDEAGAALGMTARTVRRRLTDARNGGRVNDCLDTHAKIVGYGHGVLEAPHNGFVATKNPSPLPPAVSSPMSKPITVEPITHRHNLTPESGMPCPAFCQWASKNHYPISIGL